MLYRLVDYRVLDDDDDDECFFKIHFCRQNLFCQTNLRSIKIARYHPLREFIVTTEINSNSTEKNFVQPSFFTGYAKDSDDRVEPLYP